MADFEIKEVTLKEALKVFFQIGEWNRPEAGTVEFCNKKIDGKNVLYYNL